jgi:hypothetical protein
MALLYAMTRRAIRADSYQASDPRDAERKKHDADVPTIDSNQTPLAPSLSLF